LIENVNQLAREKRFDYLLIESTGISEPMPVATTFVAQHDGKKLLGGVARLDTLVTVVDAVNFMKDYCEDQSLTDRDLGAEPKDERTIAQLLIDQVECANLIMLNKIDLVEEHEAAQLELLLKKLNPKATIIRSTFGKVDLTLLLNTFTFNMYEAKSMPGWYQELQGNHVPETLEYNISSFVFRAQRPFHRERLEELTEAGLDGVIRSKGLLWLADHDSTCMIWNQAGAETKVEVGPKWQGDKRQELVFIGRHLDEAKTREQLERALLTDSEFQTFMDELENPSEDQGSGAGSPLSPDVSRLVASGFVKNVCESEDLLAWAREFCSFGKLVKDQFVYYEGHEAEAGVSFSEQWQGQLREDLLHYGKVLLEEGAAKQGSECADGSPQAVQILCYLLESMMQFHEVCAGANGSKGMRWMIKVEINQDGACTTYHHHSGRVRFAVTLAGDGIVLADDKLVDWDHYETCQGKDPEEVVAGGNAIQAWNARICEREAAVEPGDLVIMKGGQFTKRPCLSRAPYSAGEGSEPTRLYITVDRLPPDELQQCVDALPGRQKKTRPSGKAAAAKSSSS